MGPPHTVAPPTTPEDAVRRIGRRCTIAGITMIAAPLAVIAFTASTDPDLPDWPSGTLILSLAALCACTVAGAILLGTGLIERLSQAGREQGRQVLDGQVRAGWERAQDRREVAEALDKICGAIVLLAAAVPVELDQRWFAGYSRGAEDDLTGTGTEGPARPAAIPFARRRHRT